MHVPAAERRAPRPLLIVPHAEPVVDRSRKMSQALRREVLRLGPERDKLLLEHPIVADRAYFATRAVEAMYDQIESCIRHRDTGRCFVGVPRSGKTWAIEILSRGLRQVFANLVIISLNAKQHDKSTEKGFFGDFLEDVSVPFEDKTTALVRRRRCVQHIKTRCVQSDSSTVLMFVDEGQNWHADEFTWIRDLSNDLLKFDSVTLVLVLLAQSEISLTRSKFRSTNRGDLVGRYLRDPITLGGVQSQDDLEVVLKCCDDPSLHEYPDYSGVSYSEFFLPKAYAAGWRLKGESQLLWSCICNEVAHGTSHPPNFGMAWIMNSIRDFLIRAAPFDADDLAGSAQMWKTAVRSGRYSSLSMTL